ncbi:hypothetical protein [Ferrovibrio sp.]|uniref:hypothetical protein n=1 Tax=Ferrovibrio sp. TaxID=1917215 RepID=UPI00311D50A1
MLIANLITGLVGIILLCGFLGILMVWIKAPPLVIIMLVVIAMMVFDFIRSMRDTSNTPPR